MQQRNLDWVLPILALSVVGVLLVLFYIAFHYDRTAPLPGEVNAFHEADMPKKFVLASVVTIDEIRTENGRWTQHVSEILRSTVRREMEVGQQIGDANDVGKSGNVPELAVSFFLGDPPMNFSTTYIYDPSSDGVGGYSIEEIRDIASAVDREVVAR